nr:bifunctional solanapyrone synthase [Quercus suber]
MFFRTLLEAVVITVTSTSPCDTPPPSDTDHYSSQCSELHQEFPNDVHFPNSTTYNVEQQYWSEQQASTEPACRFSPQNAVAVSRALCALRSHQCQFAVKSGGHGSFYGASNIEGGVTIDLGQLNQIQVSSSRTITHVGTGNRWEDIYTKLDNMSLAVIGGRNGDIGAGGLTLGGGISFFSGVHGWACDNVKNFEVVLADGRIVNANQHDHSDLYFALRGGGNNFGIVTRLDLDTFEQGQMWGGSTIYPLSANSSIYDAYYWFNVNAATDPKAHLIVASACVAGLGCFFANNYDYIDPVVNPPIFKNFTSLPNVTDSTRITTLLDLTNELKASQPPGYRQAFWTSTFKDSPETPELFKDILDVWYTDIQPIVNSTSFLASLVFQPVTRPIIKNFAKRGGNALGITEADGPLTSKCFLSRLSMNQCADYLPSHGHRFPVVVGRRRREIQRDSRRNHRESECTGCETRPRTSLSVPKLCLHHSRRVRRLWPNK